MLMAQPLHDHTVMRALFELHILRRQVEQHSEQVTYSIHKSQDGLHVSLTINLHFIAQQEAVKVRLDISKVQSSFQIFLNLIALFLNLITAATSHRANMHGLTSKSEVVIHIHLPGDVFPSYLNHITSSPFTTHHVAGSSAMHRVT